MVIGVLVVLFFHSRFGHRRGSTAEPRWQEFRHRGRPSHRGGGVGEGLRAHSTSLVRQRRLLSHSIVTNMLFPIALTMRLRQRRSLAQVGITAPSHPDGFALWFLLHQFALSPVACLSYAEELFRMRKRW